MLKVFITAGYIVNENDEKISIFIKDKKIKELNLNNRIKYTSRSRYNDTTIIEIKDEDKIVNNYLELDYKILLNYTKKKYKGMEAYIIQYPFEELSVSFGMILNVYDDEFEHNCFTSYGSGGSPIINLNKKVIGIHTQRDTKRDIGIGKLLIYPIEEGSLPPLVFFL